MLNKKVVMFSLLFSSVLFGGLQTNAESTNTSITGVAEVGDLKVSSKDIDLGKLVIGEEIKNEEVGDLVKVLNHTGFENGVNLMVRSNNYKTHKDNIKLALTYGDNEKLITNNNVDLENFSTDITEQVRSGSFGGEWGNFAKAGVYRNNLVWTVIPEVVDFNKEIEKMQSEMTISSPKTDYYFKHWQGTSMGSGSFKNWHSVIGAYEGYTVNSRSGNGVDEIKLHKSLDFFALEPSSLDRPNLTSSSVEINPNKDMKMKVPSAIWDKTIDKEILYPLEYMSNDSVYVETRGLLRKKVTNSDDVKKYWDNQLISGNDKITSPQVLKFTGSYGQTALEGYIPLKLKNGKILNISVTILMIHS